MGPRSRSLRSDMEMSSAQGHAKGGAQIPANVAVHPTRPFRQFSTRSRAKSAASFKGLHRIVTSDSIGEDDPSLNTNGFKKSKSTDALCRKRALSGLNMTTLGRVRSHPAQPSVWRSGSDTSPNSFSMTQTMGIKPSRSKSTHSVVELRDGDELYDDDSTTDEEVEYFTDEEEDEAHNSKSSNNSNNSHNGEESNAEKSAEEGRHRGTSTDSTPHHSHSVLLSETFSDLTVPFPEKENESHAIKQPSYKVPSNLIKQKSLNEEPPSQENVAYHNQHSSTALNIEEDDDKIFDDEKNEKLKKTQDEDDGDDHISHPDMDAFNSNNEIEDITNSLTRQVNNHNDTNTEKMIDDSCFLEESKFKGTEGDSYKAEEETSSNNEEYVPDMILSQSTGMERRFEQPPSIQNSLADDYPINLGNREEHKITNYDNANDLIGRSKYADNGEDTGYFKGQFPKETRCDTPQHPVNPISSLTTTLQGSGTGKTNGTARMENFLQKRASQNSILRSDLRSLLSSEKPQSIHRDLSSSSNVNNFAQFLKSDGMDGESRTQRKLWLQRENSIMDLSAHNDGNDPIFMASNVDVKREFERVSHEYTNVRRFANPVEEALMRIDTTQIAIGIKGSKTHGSDISDVLFPNYGSNTKVDEFLPRTENTKLHRILSGIWKEESAIFNKDTNPMNKQKASSANHLLFQSGRNALRNTMGSATGSHQRMVNSLQPTTRAVYRRMENNVSHHQRT